MKDFKHATGIELAVFWLAILAFYLGFLANCRLDKIVPYGR